MSATQTLRDKIAAARASRTSRTSNLPASVPSRVSQPVTDWPPQEGSAGINPHDAAQPNPIGSPLFPLKEDPASLDGSMVGARQPLSTSDLSHPNQPKAPGTPTATHRVSSDPETAALRARLDQTMNKLKKSQEPVFRDKFSQRSKENHSDLYSSVEASRDTTGSTRRYEPAPITSRSDTSTSPMKRAAPQENNGEPRTQLAHSTTKLVEDETAELYAKIERHHQRAAELRRLAETTDNPITINFRRATEEDISGGASLATFVPASRLNGNRPVPPQDGGGHKGQHSHPHLFSQETSTVEPRSWERNPSEPSPLGSSRDERAALQSMESSLVEPLSQARSERHSSNRIAETFQTSRSPLATTASPRQDHPRLIAHESATTELPLSIKSQQTEDQETATEVRASIAKLHAEIAEASEQARKEDELLLKARKITDKFLSNLKSEETRLKELEDELATREAEQRTPSQEPENPELGTSIDDQFEQLLGAVGPSVDSNPGGSSVKISQRVNMEEPRPYLALYDYDPLNESPNENPREELPLTAGELVYVISEVGDDGFVVAEKDDPNGPPGKTLQGLVANTFLTPFDNLNPDTAAAAVEDAQSEVRLERLAQEEVNLNGIGVVASPISEEERAIIEKAADVAVVGLPASSDTSDSAKSRTTRQAEPPRSGSKTKNGQSAPSCKKHGGKPSGKADVKRQDAGVKPVDRMEKWKRRVPRSPIVKRSGRKTITLTEDPDILKNLNEMMEAYPVKWKRIRETKPYGAPNTKTEKFRVIPRDDNGHFVHENGDDVHIMRKGNVVLVQETHTSTVHKKTFDLRVEEVWGAWNPFDKFAKRYAVTRGLAPPLRMSQANVNVPGEKKLLSKRDHVRQEIKNLDEALKSKTELERSRAALLREQIVSEKQALETETVLEADLLRELQSTNADLQGALQQKRAATRQGAAPLQRVQPGEKPKVAVKTVGELALTVDEAITAAILVVQNEFPNATIRPTDPKKKSTGSFRTYDINGVKALLTVRDAEVRVRSAHEWVSLPTFVAELAERFKAERERRERIEAERKAKQACKLQETIDVKMGNKQLRYRKLAEAYEREQKKAEDRQREVDGQVAKEHASVEALEAELQQILELQKAARARRHELLDSMEDKNNELLSCIAAAEVQVKKEEVSGLVFGGNSRIHEKKTAAVKARQEYEALKEKIEADTAAGVTPDVDALLSQYDDESHAYEATLKAENEETTTTSIAMSSTLIKARKSVDANNEESSPNFHLVRGGKADDDLERDVQDAQRQQNLVKAAEDDLDALFGSIDALKAART